MQAVRARMPERVEHWPLTRLTPYERNPRTHTEAQVQQIADSIQEFGFTVPLIVADGVILAGHGRLLAAQLLTLDVVPVIDVSHLSATQRRAYVIADNRIALNAGWDEAVLTAELTALQGEAFDLALTGFSEEELAELLPPEGGVHFNAASPGEQGRLDQRAPITCPSCGHEFTPS